MNWRAEFSLLTREGADEIFIRLCNDNFAVCRDDVSHIKPNFKIAFRCRVTGTVFK